MKAFIVYGDHFNVPSRSTSVHLSKDSADRAAGDLVNLLLADIREDNDSDLGIADVEGGKDWQPKLQALQMARIIDDLDSEQLQALEKGEAPYGYASYEAALDEISDCAVWIEEHDIVGGVIALSIAYSQALADRYKTVGLDYGSISSVVTGMPDFLAMQGFHAEPIRHTVEAGGASITQEYSALRSDMKTVDTPEEMIRDAIADAVKDGAVHGVGRAVDLLATGAAIIPAYAVHLMLVDYEHQGQRAQESIPLLSGGEIRKADPTIGVDTLAQRAGAWVEGRHPGCKVKGVIGRGPIRPKHRQTFQLCALRDGDKEEITFVASNMEEAKMAAFHYLCAYFRIGFAYSITDPQEAWDELASECDYCTLEPVA